MRMPRMLTMGLLACGLFSGVAAGAQAETPAGQSLGIIRADAADAADAGRGAMAPAGVLRADAAETAHAADAADAPGGASGTPIGLSAERAQLLLRSLTVPGWGQATARHKKSAAAFALAEIGVWTSFTAFRIQSHLRKQTSERTAHLFAGVDLSGRDEEYRRIVGAYISSDEYNQLVVYRDAANLYYNDPVAYRAYIADHLVPDADTWSWDSDENLLRYRDQRKDAQRASIRANTALACAVVNRLLSMVHAARIHTADVPARSWNFEVTPAPSEDAFAYRMGVRARF